MHRTLKLALALLIMPAVEINSTGAAEKESDWLISPALLEHANMKIVWQSYLPIRPGEKLQNLTLVGERVYALSNNNYMVSMEDDTGKVVFAKPVAPKGFPLLGLDLYDKTLISVIGNTIYEIEPGTGVERRRHRLDYGIVCPVARNGDFYYVGAVDNRVHTLKADNMVRVFQAGAPDESRIQYIVADEQSVMYGTNSGYLISVAAGKPIRQWQFKVSDGIVGPIVKDGDSLFFACEDTNVYRVDVRNADSRAMIWKCQMDSPLEVGPRVTESFVYQYGRGKGLTAIDRNSGRRKWSVREGVDLLAEAAGKAYVISDENTMVVMDNTTGRKLCSVNFAAVHLNASNVTGKRIFVAGERGRVACLQPAK